VDNMDITFGIETSKVVGAKTKWISRGGEGRRRGATLYPNIYNIFFFG